jgi:L-ascorbate metabolism protein UlaG (beta-lactamase superfamily)
MKIKWLGHAAFLITSEAGIKTITDPYTPTEELSYGEIKESADIVTVSHGHSDHGNVASVRGNPRIVKGTAEVRGIKFRGIAVHHDEAQGKKRGSNIIFCLEVDGIKLCHLGDLGHQLTDKQVAEIGKVDILLVPVGGFYTIDATVATRVCDQLKPGIIIPMHFKNDKCDYPITGVEEFLRGKKDIRQLEASEIEFKTGKLPPNTQIIVLRPAL